MTTALREYAADLARRMSVRVASGEVFAKILTANDDSGRHGVLIPSEAYDFFPAIHIPHETANATVTFVSLDVLKGESHQLSWKYYQRYPERRITKLSARLNGGNAGRRMVVFTRLVDVAGQEHCFDECLIDADGAVMAARIDMLFGQLGAPTLGAFVRLPIDFQALVIDTPLSELLKQFDAIRNRGWVSSLRKGHTGLGYTFETMMGIEENNDRLADFMGIELKCKLACDIGARAAGGKINLFQQGPVWTDKRTAIERLQVLGQMRPDGKLACYSQVTVSANNLGLRLAPNVPEDRIDLYKLCQHEGLWPIEVLKKRLREKHSRAAFIKADVRPSGANLAYHYRELVYCERPSIETFMELVGMKAIVFEFTMSQSAKSVRNHGYPWRLVSDSLLDRLFKVKVSLR